MRGERYYRLYRSQTITWKSEIEHHCNDIQALSTTTSLITSPRNNRLSLPYSKRFSVWVIYCRVMVKRLESILPPFVCGRRLTRVVASPSQRLSLVALGASTPATVDHQWLAPIYEGWLTYGNRRLINAKHNAIFRSGNVSVTGHKKKSWSQMRQVVKLWGAVFG